jgi:hypothetical protein
VLAADGLAPAAEALLRYPGARAMAISAAVERLAQALIQHIAATRQDAALVAFVNVIGSMPEWVERRSLDRWEESVHAQEVDWELREARPDELFMLAIEIFDFGRCNLYSVIDARRTRREFDRLRANLVRARVGPLPEANEFDFHRW